MASLPFQAIAPQQEVPLVGRLLAVLRLLAVRRLVIVRQFARHPRRRSQYRRLRAQKAGWQGEPANAACFWCFALRLVQTAIP